MTEKPELDSLIDAVLSAEPQRPVPRNLYGKIRERLAVLALIEAERQWLRQASAWLGILLAALAGLGAILWILKEFLNPMLFYIPGALGLWDYVVNSAVTDLPQLIAAAAVLALLPAAAVLALILSPRRRAME